MNKEKRLFVLEGGIAAGKSTWGLALEATGRVGYIPEPTVEWQTKFTKTF